MKLWRTLLVLLFAVPVVWAQRSPRVVDSLAAMAALPRSSANPDVLVQGVNGGSFKWVSNSTTATNVADVVASPYGAASGRYIRQPLMGGTVDLGSAGITFDGGTNGYPFTIQDTSSTSIEGGTAQLTGLTDLTLDGQRTLEVFARTNFYLWTPAVWAGTATNGQVLKLVNSSDASTEFAYTEDTAMRSGDSVGNALLRGWAHSGAWQITSAIYDSDLVLSNAAVRWPDGATGTWQRTTKNATFLTVDAYTITHSSSGKTLTQSLILRDSNGNVTNAPAITITP